MKNMTSPKLIWLKALHRFQCRTPYDTPRFVHAD